jgi:CBS domain-containing membrane protein
MKIFPVNPVMLSIKGKLLAILVCFIVILIIALVSHHVNLTTGNPILIASMGASAVIVFIIPNSPLAQPWPLIGGQLVSALVGVASAQLVTNIPFAAALAVGGSVFAMLLLRCLHPPGAASALAPVMATTPVTDYDFVIMPVGLNVTVMLIMAIAINRWLLQHDYPSGTKHIPHQKNLAEQAQPHGISGQDLATALENMDTFLDVSSGDLTKLLSEAQKQSFIRASGPISCADIMADKVFTVEYGTEVEDAWKLMQRENLKALPVIDRSRRVIGIITWHDFFKFIDVNAEASFQEKFWAFICRTPDISAKKPESVGHIMAAPVKVVTGNSHISELIPMMSNEGHVQIPIVDAENRLIGMVYQANLIAALYNECFDCS